MDRLALEYELAAHKDAAVELFGLLDAVYREDERTRGDDALFRVRALALVARRHQVLNDDGITIRLAGSQQRKALEGGQGEASKTSGSGL